MSAWIMNAYAGAIALTLLALLVFLGGIPHSLASHECTWSALHPRLTGVLCLTAAPYNVAFLGGSIFLVLCAYTCARIAEEVFPARAPNSKKRV